MFIKTGATTFNQNDFNSKWHLSSYLDETETESPKWLEKLVPQHSIAMALTQNDTCQVVFTKLKLNHPNV